MKPWTRAFGLWQGAVPTETLTLTFPPASWDLSETAVRQGMAGSTLAGAHILIPGTGAEPSRYLWFSHNDGNGVFTGTDPGQWVPALSGLAGIEVQLPAGNSTAAAVAALAELELSAFYSTTRVDEVVEVTGQIDAAAASTGDAWAARGNASDIGPGIILGMLHITPQATFGGFTVTEARCARLDPAEIPAGLWRIIGLQVSLETVTTDQLRLALFAGGTTDTNPAGATLLVDFGQTTGNNVNWRTIILPESQVIEVDGSAAPRLWLAFKGTTNTQINAAGTGTGFEGNYATSPGIFRSNSMNTSPGTPFEATWSAGSAGTFAFVPCVRLILQRVNAGGSYSSDGSWFRRLGTNEDNVAAFPDQIPIDVMVGMSMLSPPVEGMTLDYMEIAYRSISGGNLFRLGLYTGGALSGPGAPNGDPLLWDAGITPNPGANAYGRINAPTGASAITVPPSTVLWPFFRDNANVTQVAFDSGVPTVFSTVQNPAPGITVEGGSEYEITSASPSMSTDNAVPYEDPFVTDASDIQPGNNVPLRVAMSVPGFGLAA